MAIRGVNGVRAGVPRLGWARRYAGVLYRAWVVHERGRARGEDSVDMCVMDFDIAMRVLDNIYGRTRNGILPLPCEHGSLLIAPFNACNATQRSATQRDLTTSIRHLTHLT